MLEMSDRDKFLFDLHGYLVVKEFLTKEEVGALNAAIDAMHDQVVPDGNRNTASSDTLEGEDGKPRDYLGRVLTWPKPHCQPFRDLLAHRKLLPYLNTILGRGWKIDHDPAIFLAEKGAEGLIMHGSTARFPNPLVGYSYANGRMRSGMVSLEYTLTPQDEGDGGFACIPGTHRSNFRPPQEILAWQADRELIVNVPLEVGDLLIFSEALCHGTLPWTAVHERRAALYRYSPRHLHFAGSPFRVTKPEWVAELTETQQAVLEPPYVYNRPIIDDDATIARPRVD